MKIKELVLIIAFSLVLGSCGASRHSLPSESSSSSLNNSSGSHVESNSYSTEPIHEHKAGSPTI